MKTARRLFATIAMMALMMALAISLVSAGSTRRGFGIAKLVVPASRMAQIASGEFQVSFKLDLRLTGGSYMGERWGSPVNYDTVQTGSVFNQEARAEVVDALGQRTVIGAEWISSDPEMVAISPGQNGRVTITVHRAGQSLLRVSAQGSSREFTITAAPYGCGAMRVSISQQPGVTVESIERVCELRQLRFPMFLR